MGCVLSRHRRLGVRALKAVSSPLRLQILNLLFDIGLQKENIITEGKMKATLPKTYSYFYQFKHILLTRGSNVARELAEREAFLDSTISSLPLSPSLRHNTIILGLNQNIGKQVVSR